MRIGIGLPSMVPDRPGRSVGVWAAAAEAAGFSTLAVNDVLLSDNFEPLMTLAAAAAVTSSIRLLTSVLIAPLHTNVPLFAKQVATLDVISEGRLSLGIAVGPRASDYAASGVAFEQRGRLMDELLRRLQRLWSEPSAETPGPTPAQATGPELLIGASSPPGMRRLAVVGHGYISGYGPPARFAELARTAQDIWATSGRAGEFRTIALTHFALGANAGAAAKRYFDVHRDVFVGNADRVLAATALSATGIEEAIGSFSAIDCDEMIFMPCAHGVEQVELLAAVAGVKRAIRP